MKISRHLALKVHYFFDQWVPPAIRDAKWFMAFPFKFLFGNKSKVFFNFKNKAHYYDAAEYMRVYKDVDSVLMERETDLNQKCIDAIMAGIVGTAVLEVGCGRGFLANKLSERFKVTAVDMQVSSELKKKYPSIVFKEANIERLPFDNESFDTVVCTHTLEHVQNFPGALSELRRITKKRLIIVVPKQRPYKYTFDLHLHFFPYDYVLLGMVGKQTNQKLKELDGDWFYFEDYESQT